MAFAYHIPNPLSLLDVRYFIHFLLLRKVSDVMSNKSMSETTKLVSYLSISPLSVSITQNLNLLTSVSGVFQGTFCLR